MPYPYLDMAYSSNCGSIRKKNEDAGCIAASLGFCAVADGLGGCSAGDVASAMVLSQLKEQIGKETVSSWTERRSAIHKALLVADHDLMIYAQEKGYKNGCGSTVAGLLFNQENPLQALGFNIGDSRIYRMRDKKLTLLSQDHTIAAETGIPEQDLPHIYHGMLTKAIGFGFANRPTMVELSMQEKDLYLLCTDGLNKVFNDRELEAILGAYIDDNAEVLLETLIKNAMMGISPDNITAVIVKISNFVEKNDFRSQEKHL
ncbi:MAG: PP2C family serine/threonine-protein phosphatase [Lentisphaeria bacterium]